MISSTGDGAFAAALPLLAATITRDLRLVSVVTAATHSFWLLLSLPAGAVVDRYDRATLMPGLSCSVRKRRSSLPTVVSSGIRSGDWHANGPGLDRSAVRGGH